MEQGKDRFRKPLIFGRVVNDQWIRLSARWRDIGRGLPKNVRWANVPQSARLSRGWDAIAMEKI